MSLFDIFSSPIEKLVQTATHETKDTPDWAAFSEIWDLANRDSEASRDLAKILRKRIVTKHPQSCYLALCLLEACVKNCGKYFHELVATKDMQSSLIAASRSPFNQVKDKALELIISFAEAFKNNKKLAIFQETYQQLHESGVQFPARDMTALAPVITPQRRTTHDHPHTNNTQSTPSTTPSISSSHPLCSLTPQFLEKLRNEFEIIRNYLVIAIEMFGASSIEDLKNHRHTVNVLAEIRNRLAQLMAEIDDDSIIDIALQLNENIRSVQEYFKAKANAQNPTLPKFSAVSLKILDVKIHGKDEEKANHQPSNPSAQSNPSPTANAATSALPPSASSQPAQQSAPLDLSIFDQSSSSSNLSEGPSSDPFAAIAKRSEQPKQGEDDPPILTPSNPQPNASSTVSPAAPIDLLSLLDPPATGSSASASSHSSASSSSSASAVSVDPLAALFGAPVSNSQSGSVEVNASELEDLLNLTNAPSGSGGRS